MTTPRASTTSPRSSPWPCGRRPVAAHRISDALQVAGVNSPCNWPRWSAPTSCARPPRCWSRACAWPTRHALTCATTHAPACAASCCAQDVEIDVGCIFTGRVVLGEGVQVGAHRHRQRAHWRGAVIHPYTHIDGEQMSATVGEGALVGPLFACAPVRNWAAGYIGNFVEVKTPPWPMVPRPTTWPIWATPPWANA